MTEAQRTFILACKQLVDKMRLVHGDPSFKGVWALYFAHGGNYTGPSYGAEFDAVERALAELGEIALNEQVITPASTDSKPALRQLLRDALEANRMEEDNLELYERIFQMCSEAEMDERLNGGPKTRREILSENRARSAQFTAARIYLESLFKAEDAASMLTNVDVLAEVRRLIRPTILEATEGAGN
jgi:hypothetical protein